MNPALPRLPAAVLWDMDGTLVDTEPYWFAAERELVGRFGHGDWPDELAHGMVGFDLMDGAAYLQQHGGVELPADEIVDRLLDSVVAGLLDRIPWRPGARRLLRELNEAGVPCALVTMSWHRLVDPVVDALPSGAFVAVVTGDDLPAGQGKPGPLPYRMGADACHADPADCVAIEDSPTGVRSALAAGCSVLGVPNVRSLDPAPGMRRVRSLESITLDDLSALLDAPGRPARRAEGAPSRRGWGLPAIAAVAVLVLAGWIATRGDSTEPLPPGAVPIDLWAPYWTLGDSLPKLDARMDAVREASPFWFGARGVTLIVSDENASPTQTKEFIDRLRATRARVVPSIRDEMPAGAMARVLTDPVTRTQHVAAIVAFADGLDADGIDLDYEQFAFADGSSTWTVTQPAWVAFVRELSDALHGDGRTLTVSIPPVYDQSTTGQRGYWVYDHGTIAEYVDAIRIMAYDYSVADVGPIAPLAWVGDAVAGVSAAVPAEYHSKLVLGVPSYGRNWVTATSGACPTSAEGTTTVTARTVTDLVARRATVAPTYDPVTAEWSFTYELAVGDATSSCVQSRSVRWVDAEGVAARVRVAREAGWGGVALWAFGYDDDAVWASLVNAAHVQVVSATPSTDIP